MKFSNLAQEHLFAELKEKIFSYQTSGSSDQVSGLQSRIQELEKELHRQKTSSLEIHTYHPVFKYDFNTESLH